MWQQYSGLFKNLKWYWQRATRGYADCDVWSLDGYLSEIIPPVIRKLKTGCGCPSELYDKEKVNDECWKWKKILEEIAQGFEAYRGLNEMKYYVNKKTEKGYEHSVDVEKQKNFQEKFDRGIELFVKYYTNLWD